jgi:DNA-directed RNA polymerase specialized sigma24 family protein
VTARDLAELYERKFRIALSVAGRIAGFHAAEDIVHDVFAYMWQRRDYLQYASDGYLMVGIRHAAIGQAIKTRRARVISLGGSRDLLALEERLQLKRDERVKA